MINKNDWRLKRPRKYLEKITLHWTTFQPFKKGMESDHCEFCWAKFVTQPKPDAQHEGYSTLDHYYWICKNCFEDFKDMFHWNVK